MEYIRKFVDPATGRTVGGSLLHRWLARLSRWFGQPRTGPLRLNGEGDVMFLDLSDGRFLGAVTEALRGDSVEQRLMATILAPGDTFIDVGANHGAYAIAASRLVGPGGFVVAFEPIESLAELVRRSLEWNDASPYVTHSYACSDRDGILDFHVPKTGSGRASLYREFAGSSDVTSVRTVRLDDMLDPTELPGSLLLKIDVEGSELACLQGAERLIRERRPTILLEINPASARAAGVPVEASLEFLSERGYAFQELDSFDRAVPLAEVDPNRQRNILARP